MTAAIPAILSLTFVWFTLINQVRPEWTLNPQYNYGWAVPFLCGLLVWRKVNKIRGLNSRRRSQLPLIFLILLAAAWLPARLIAEANPDWRLVSWLLALEAVGMTWCMVYLAGNRRLFLALAMPVAYFLVAVPWPTMIEAPLVQGLMRVVAGLTVSGLEMIGIPAIRHGNVVEVATGVVGIDEACSGIRSFQATLMISLFLGEFYRLTWIRRSVFVLAGFALALLFNTVRTMTLTAVASRRGAAAVAAWHDPAGVTILLACFVCLWLFGLWLKRGMPAKSKSSPALADAAPLSARDDLAAHFRWRAGLLLCVWLALAEGSVWWWYHSHEVERASAPQWSVALPTNSAAFKTIPIEATTRQMLRYDEGRNAGWTGADGTKWQLIYLRWKAGRVATFLARNHTPEVCLTVAGRKLISASALQQIEVNDLTLPFYHYVLEDPTGKLNVFYCLWEDRANEEQFNTESLTFSHRMELVATGLRNLGQRSVEIALWGVDDPELAEVLLRQELPNLIVNNQE